MIWYLLNDSQGYILTCRAVLLYRCAIPCLWSFMVCMGRI
nr:MAG TPA: hypothetical protein [Caudoviricetes sp.]